MVGHVSVPHRQRRFLRARTIPELLRALAELTEPVHTLDVFAHGFGGGMTFGGETLFASDGHGYERVEAFRRLIIRGGHLRLLGCQTALDSSWKEGAVELSGATLLRDLAQRLGAGITTWGSTVRLSCFHFDAGGLSRHIARATLVSWRDGTDRARATKAEREVGIACRV